MAKKKTINKPKNDFESQKKQAEEYLAGWQRSLADFENYKKQQQEWSDDFRLFAKEEILREIIPVIDNFELALSHTPNDPQTKSWSEGIAHVKRQLEEILNRNNVKNIEVKSGDLFDPRIHECVSEPEKENKRVCVDGNSENQKNNLIVKEVLGNGYILGEKILRPAKVTIIMKIGKND
ncbi:MAG: nucleotide exchange factor GrpE [Candidatus Moraniibacteriota bacterium]